MASETAEKAKDALLDAKISMIVNMPFYGVLASRLELIPSYGISSLGVDGKRLFFHPHFVMSRLGSRKKIVFALMHEVLHLVLGHVFRIGNRDKKLWNVACDYAVNGILYQYQKSLADNAFFAIPEFILLDAKFFGKTAEEIYDILFKESLSGKVTTFDFHDVWYFLGKKEREEREREWSFLAASTAERNGFASDLPKEVSQSITEFFLPKKDWRVELAEFIQQVSYDYDFLPPDPRYSEYDFFMPDVHSVEEGLKDVYLYIDVSGSVDEGLLHEFISEVIGCYSQFGEHSEIYYGTFDTTATPPKRMDRTTEIVIHGRGGTYPKSVFDVLEESGRLEKAQAILFLTDGFFDPIPVEYARGVPVLWVISPNGEKQSLIEEHWQNIILL